MRPDKQIVLVEPAAGVRHGHFVEKLALWCDGMAKIGFSPTVVCWDPPAELLPGATYTKVTFRLARWFYCMVPQRRKAMWTELWTYLQAFKLARSRACPVLGLTTSSPIPVAAAAWLARPVANWGQIVMYSGLYQTPAGLSIRPRALKAFQSLFGSGCRLLCNAPLTAEMLERHLVKTPSAGRIRALTDPIYASQAFMRPCGEKRTRPVTVLVPGHDDDRRTPLGHLARANFKTPIEKLTAHQAGKKNLALADGTAWPRSPFVREAELLTDYLPGDALAGVFANAKFCLMVYDPNFFSGSANLALSVVCGTPVLCSRFPYAESLFCEFGRIGEQFDYGDAVDMAKGWERLNSWNVADWDEFEGARRRLLVRVDHREVVRLAAEFLGLGSIRP